MKTCDSARITTRMFAGLQNGRAVVRHVIEAAPPSEIICVGKGVGKVLATRLRGTGATVTVVPQPNARATTAEQELALATYWDVIRRAAAIEGEWRTPCAQDFRWMVRGTEYQNDSTWIGRRCSSRRQGVDPATCNAA